MSRSTLGYWFMPFSSLQILLYRLIPYQYFNWLSTLHRSIENLTYSRIPMSPSIFVWHISFLPGWFQHGAARTSELLRVRGRCHICYLRPTSRSLIGYLHSTMRSIIGYLHSTSRSITVYLRTTSRSIIGYLHSKSNSIIWHIPSWRYLNIWNLHSTSTAIFFVFNDIQECALFSIYIIQRIHY